MADKFKLIMWLLLCFPIVAIGENKKAFSVGGTLDLSQLQDQNGNNFEHGEQMRLVLFVRGMETKDLAGNALADIDPKCLGEGNVVYVADIHKMPGMISKLVAIPRMRKLAYPIWLDRDGETTSAMPVEEDSVSVITLEKREIVRVEYEREKSALSQRLQEQCAVTP